MEDVIKYGIYYYKTKSYNGFILNEVNVTVVAENNTHYKISLNGYTTNKIPNQKMVVKKKNVKILKIVQDIKNKTISNTIFEEKEYWWEKI
jgi:hypothetical protein